MIESETFIPGDEAVIADPRVRRKGQKALGVERVVISAMNTLALESLYMKQHIGDEILNMSAVIVKEVPCGIERSESIADIVDLLEDECVKNANEKSSSDGASCNERFDANHPGIE